MARVCFERYRTTVGFAANIKDKGEIKMMELKIVQPTKFIEAIEFNFEELKGQLKESLEKYQNLTFTEEQIKLAKADRATLNKLKDAIETKRKEIKAKCLRPYEEFEIKIKELIKLIDEPINNIDGQIKLVEEEKKNQKVLEITKIFDKYALENNINELITCQRVFNQKWLNTSYKLSTIEQEIKDTTKNIADSIKVIGETKTEFAQQVLDKYLQTLDLTVALAENTRLCQQKERLEKMKAEQEKRQTEEKQVAKPTVEEQQPTELKQIDFRVWVTEEQKKQLRAFLIENNIKYGAVK